MSSLERFQVPHDPGSLHQLHWEPGQYGKGILTDDGTLHHWGTQDILDGGISHRQYMMHHGMGDSYDVNQKRKHRLFWIHPGGEVETLPNGETWGDLRMSEALLRQVQAVDPRLGPFAPPEWRFADARSQQRALDDLPEEPPPTEPVTHDWDLDGDVGRHPDIQWVPTHELAKFLEYDRRPGGKDSEGNADRWKALTEHVQTHGFRNPVWIDFNPDGNTAHLSEGNHRVQIALDTGMPAVPVRVYRSHRSSPTQVKVTPDYSQAQRDYTGDRYWPEYMRAEHIGLPVVPPPEQQHVTSALQRQPNPWRPGVDGKGFLDPQGNLHLWQLDESFGPLHAEVAQARGTQVDTPFYVQPDGAVYDSFGRLDAEKADWVVSADPRLHHTYQEGWSF